MTYMKVADYKLVYYIHYFRSMLWYSEGVGNFFGVKGQKIKNNFSQAMHFILLTVKIVLSTHIMWYSIFVY